MGDLYRHHLVVRASLHVFFLKKISQCVVQRFGLSGFMAHSSLVFNSVFNLVFFTVLFSLRGTSMSTMRRTTRLHQARTPSNGRCEETGSSQQHRLPQEWLGGARTRKPHLQQDTWRHTSHQASCFSWVRELPPLLLPHFSNSVTFAGAHRRAGASLPSKKNTCFVSFFLL